MLANVRLAVTARFCMLLGFLVGLGGCFGTQPPPDFYLLEPLAKTPAGNGPGPTAPVIGVGPVRFPRYVNRPQLIVAQAGGRFVLRENQRWAEDLGDNFSRVFSEDLAARVPTVRVLLHPWPRQQDVDFKVTVRVNEFHLAESGVAKLDGRWELYGKQGLLMVKRSLYSVPFGEGSEGKGVVALSRAVDLLSTEVAAAINGFYGAVR